MFKAIMFAVLLGFLVGCLFGCGSDERFVEALCFDRTGVKIVCP